MVSGKMNPPQPLKIRGAINGSKEWKKFKQAWQVYEIASGTNEKSDVVRLATFLHVAGPEGLEKFSSFKFESEEESNNLARILEKFDNDCKETCNILAERKKFYHRKQKKGETYDQYIMDLRILASSCEFANNEEMLRDQFVLNINNERAKERLLTEAQTNYHRLTFEKAISIARMYEALKSQDDETEMEVDMIRKQNRTGNSFNKSNSCNYCGRFHSYGKCPAYGKTCNSCNGKNHFAQVCKKKNKVNFVSEETIAEPSTSQTSFNKEIDGNGSI